MSAKEGKAVKKKSRKLLSLPSFRKSKKLNQIKEDVCLEANADISDIVKNKHGSSGSLPSIGLEATVSLDSPKKEDSVQNERLDVLDQCNDTSTPNSERRSFSNLRSAYLENPDLVIPVSPRVRRLDLGGLNNLSTDSGIDCSVLLSEKGSPERFQEFTRREAERLRLEHLRTLSDSLPSQATDIAENLQNGLLNVTDNGEKEEGFGNTEAIGASDTSSLQDKIEQTKEHISLLSELRTVLEQKLEACNDNSVDVDSVHRADVDELIPTENGLDIIETLNTSALGVKRNTSVSSGADNTGSSPNVNGMDNYNLYLHTNKTDERKSEEARLRRENDTSFTNGLLVDSPHLIVSPTPVVSTAATASHRILPSTPSPVRLYVNEKSAFAKCKSLRRSVSDVGKGLLEKLRQKKKSEFHSKYVNNRTDRHTSESLKRKDKNNHQDKEIDPCSNYNSLPTTFSAHLETSLLCGETDSSLADISTSVVEDMTNSSIEDAYEIELSEFKDMEPNLSHRQSVVDVSDCYKESFGNSISHSQGSINAIQELTTSICEMTSKLTFSSSADSIACICDCKNRSSSPPCCDKSKTPSPVNVESLENMTKARDDGVIDLQKIDACDKLVRVSLSDNPFGKDSVEGENHLNIEMKENYIEPVNVINDAHASEHLKLPVTELLGNHTKPQKDTETSENNGETECDNVFEETDTLLQKPFSDTNKSSTQMSVSQFNKSKIVQSSIYNYREVDKTVSSDNCNLHKTYGESIKDSWFCDTEDDSSDNDSSESSCSGCSDKYCTRKVVDRINVNTVTDSSSEDTSPADFNSSDKSSESDSESSSLECTPEKVQWQDANLYKDDLIESPYSVSFKELDMDGFEPPYINESISNYERHLHFPMNSPQSNFPSPEVRHSPAYINNKTPASSPISPFYTRPLPSNNRLDIFGGCRRKDSYMDFSAEQHIPQAYNTSRAFECSGDNGSSEAMLSEVKQEKQPDLINSVINSPATSPLDLSFKKEQKSSKTALWMDRHVGQVFSPARRVLHKNQDLSETDLCRTILDLYVSDAEESGFEPEFESSFNSSLNCSNSFSSSLNYSNSLNNSSSFNSSLNSSSYLEPEASDDDSKLQYGTYVAPRRPKKETNVDDFSTTVVSSCYSAEAKTRKLQGGKLKFLYCRA